MDQIKIATDIGERQEFFFFDIIQISIAEYKLQFALVEWISSTLVILSSQCSSHKLKAKPFLEMNLKTQSQQG